MSGGFSPNRQRRILAEGGSGAQTSKVGLQNLVACPDQDFSLNRCSRFFLELDSAWLDGTFTGRLSPVEGSEGPD